ncbi:MULTISPECIES: ethylbenzene dehydrogenase-related protein [Rhodomicrobium]|uniref:ethylbenzene dehydrogenase-related protein n=1 Tax=Rhodomicrobium TaxID=1068 RepID=UPI000B4C101F|nr:MULTISPECIES: ethylbenzene dehydrogenase-related protein [Rhodomicrobium]
MARRAIRKTDLGTILLHWTLVGLLLVAVTTGLRIAIGSPYDMTWLQAFDLILPQSAVWTWHIPAGALLFGLAVSYAIYLARTGLSRRIKPDRARLSGLAGSKRARLGAINVIFYWIFFLTILLELVTGILLYLGYAGMVADLHFLGTWIVIAYLPAHLLMHHAIGGARQLLRIFVPGRLAPPPPPFDPFELLAEAAMRDRAAASRLPAPTVHPQISSRHPPSVVPLPARRGRPGEVLHAHPLVVAIGGGMAAMAVLMSLDHVGRDTLVIEEIERNDGPAIDGDISDRVWSDAEPVLVRTQQGANLNGAGGTIVEIRAVHDGTNAYFSFVWTDPTRSLKHLPLAKTKAGWMLVHDRFDLEDANAFFEDKLAVLIAPGYTLIPGDRTFHAGHKPIPDAPPSASGRGLHYTTDGSMVDVWQWHATGGTGSGWVDDSHFGPPAQPTQAELDGVEAYKGGFVPDPGTAPVGLNFKERRIGGYDTALQPLRLPKNLAETDRALGAVDLDPDRGESDGAKWWLPASESVPYSKALDDAIPVGTIIPGIIAAGDASGDRADLACAAKWAAGRWVLEVVRRLDTRSRFDVPIKTDSYLRVAVFDHSQTRHTRHIRPIRLQVNTCKKAAQCPSMVRNSPPSGVTSF